MATPPAAPMRPRRYYFKEWRKHFRLRQIDVAEAMGAHISTVKALEKGEGKPYADFLWAEKYAAAIRTLVEDRGDELWPPIGGDVFFHLPDRLPLTAIVGTFPEDEQRLVEQFVEDRAARLRRGDGDDEEDAGDGKGG